MKEGAADPPATPSRFANTVPAASILPRNRKRV